MEQTNSHVKGKLGGRGSRVPSRAKSTISASLLTDPCQAASSVPTPPNYLPRLLCIYSTLSTPNRGLCALLPFVQLNPPSIMSATTTKRVNGHANGTAKKTKSPAITTTEIRDEKTDYSRWRLRNDRGTQTWQYLESAEEMKAWPQSTADKYWLGLDTVWRFNSLFWPDHCSYHRALLASMLHTLQNIKTDKLTGAPRSPPRPHPPPSRPQRPHFLLRPPIPLRQLGHRIRRSHVSAPRSRHHMVCDRHTDPMALPRRNQKLSLGTSASGGWGLGAPY